MSNRTGSRNTLFRLSSRDQGQKSLDDDLAPFRGENYHHDNVPADNERVKQIYYPNQSSYAHGDRDCHQLADEHTTEAPELNGQMRDQGVHFERSNMKRHQRREQIENLKPRERPTGAQDSAENDSPRTLFFAIRKFGRSRWHSPQFTHELAKRESY